MPLVPSIFTRQMTSVSCSKWCYRKLSKFVPWILYSTLKNLEHPCLYHGGPEDPSIPMIRHHRPLKMEKGARVSPTLAKSSARKMELGQGWEITEAEKKRNQEKKSLLGNPSKADTVGLKGNPVKFYTSLWTLCFSMISLYWALLSKRLFLKTF